MPRGYSLTCVDRDPALFLELHRGGQLIADAACVPSLDPDECWVYEHSCIRRAGWALALAAHVHHARSVQSVPDPDCVPAMPRRGEG
jgi:hypothetical protein